MEPVGSGSTASRCDSSPSTKYRGISSSQLISTPALPITAYSSQCWRRRGKPSFLTCPARHKGVPIVAVWFTAWQAVAENIPFQGHPLIPSATLNSGNVATWGLEYTVSLVAFCGLTLEHGFVAQGLFIPCRLISEAAIHCHQQTHRIINQTRTSQFLGSMGRTREPLWHSGKSREKKISGVHPKIDTAANGLGGGMDRAPSVTLPKVFPSIQWDY